jgi:hypothetical protein
MNTLYVIGGIVFLIFGIWLSIIKIRNFARRRQSILGSDAQLFWSGIMLIMLGVYLVIHYI